MEATDQFPLPADGESWASTPGSAASMRGNRRRDTKPELALRRALHAMGYRFRVDYAPLAEMRRRRADIVFTRQRVAVFVDGCFWHGCPEHYKPPSSNSGYWLPKISRNSARDIDTTARLVDAGWTVVRVWEHTPIDQALAEVVAVLKYSQR